MKLSFSQIQSVAVGAVRAVEEDGRLRLCRFTKEQEDLYSTCDPAYYQRALLTAGIRLWFKTDSTQLGLKGTASNEAARSYYSLDVFVNEQPVGHIDNISDVEMPECYTTVQLPLGDFEKRFDLGGGEKTVCVYLPWSAKLLLEEVSLDDGAFIEPVKPAKKLLVFGDSISQGYDAQRPSRHHMVRLADRLGAQMYNKAVGGEKFFPALAALKDDFEPDYITVAYGTNDWSTRPREQVRTTCIDFYQTLSRTYPHAKIFAITPIWRKDHTEYREFGDFFGVQELIAEAVKDLDNVTYVPGFDLVPKDEKYYADARLHPNDRGFDFYFENLWEKIQAAL